jgi:hypothetical protein
MIIFTVHSLLKLKQRKIPKRLVVEAVKNPDHACESHSNRKACFKKINELYLKVVYKNEANNTIVITQHWVKEIN